MSKAHLYALTAAGQSVPSIVDELGNFAGGGGGAATGSSAATADSKGWAYVAAAGGVTDTSDVTLAAAPGANKCNYITSLQVINKSASVDTEVVVKSGSTVLFRGFAGAGGNGFIANFSRPLVSAGNTAMTAACITTSSATLINAQGFIAGLPNQVEQLLTTINELVDDLGAYVLDDSSNRIWVE
jgi:hypothetical protein